MGSFIKVQGTKLVDGDGKEVILRGAGLGGWQWQVFHWLYVSKHLVKG